MIILVCSQVYTQGLPRVYACKLASATHASMRKIMSETHTRVHAIVHVHLRVQSTQVVCRMLHLGSTICAP